jgi:hypothetical protein
VERRLLLLGRIEKSARKSFGLIDMLPAVAAIHVHPDRTFGPLEMLDGKSRSIFASGLRDTVGWGWQPQTGELWAMDNGMNALGDNL